MSDFDLAGLRVAAAADPRPKLSVPDEIPTGTSPADQAVAGYAMAVNLVTQAAEIARLQIEGGTADPAVIDELNAEWVRATLNARYCAELHTIAQASYERIFELMDPRQAGTTPTEMLERMAATVEEINALTQRLIDEYRSGASVHEFLSARTLDTTVPRY